MDYGKDFPETGPAPFGVKEMTAAFRAQEGGFKPPTRQGYFLHMARYFHKREAQHAANDMPLSAEQAAYQAGKYLGWAYSIS